jgi:hypothetical protein
MNEILCILNSQIETGTRMNLGMRDAVYDNAANSLQWTVGSGREYLRKLVVSYDLGTDTYTVRYYQMCQLTLEVVEDRTVPLVYVDALNEIMIRMASR